MRIDTAIVAEAIDVSALAAAVGEAATGAVVSFAGVVRNHDDGRAVLSLDYSGHPTAASALAATVAETLAEHPDVVAAAAEHRVGHLEIGDVALGLAVSAAHRGAAFAAASALVDAIKARVPIWKHQHFADGTSQWSNCP